MRAACGERRERERSDCVSGGDSETRCFVTYPDVEEF